MKTPTPFIVGLIIGGMCLIGMLPLPYPYYPFLRLVILVGAATLIGCSVIRKKYVPIVPLAVIALFFFGVKGLDKSVWAFIDLVAGVCFIGIGGWLAGFPTDSSSQDTQ